MNFKVRSTDSGFTQLLATYLEEFRVLEGGSDEGVYSADCGEDKVLAGGKIARAVKTLYLDGGRIYRGRVSDEMAGRLIATLRDLTNSWTNELVRVRAGGVALDGISILLPSIPEPHLPALVALLVKHGGAYLGDELVGIDPILRQIHGSKLPILVDSEDLNYFPELDREPPARRPKITDEYARALTPRRPLTLSEIGGSLAKDSPPIGWIVFPYFEPGEETRLEPFGGSSALFRFIESGLNLHIWEDRAFTLMKDLLDSTPVSRLIVGSIPDAADLLMDTHAGVMGR